MPVLIHWRHPNANLLSTLVVLGSCILAVDDYLKIAEGSLFLSTGTVGERSKHNTLRSSGDCFAHDISGLSIVSRT